MRRVGILSGSDGSRDGLFYVSYHCECLSAVRFQSIGRLEPQWLNVDTVQKICWLSNIEQTAVFERRMLPG